MATRNWVRATRALIEALPDETIIKIKVGGAVGEAMVRNMNGQTPRILSNIKGWTLSYHASDWYYSPNYSKGYNINGDSEAGEYLVEADDEQFKKSMEEFRIRKEKEEEEAKRVFFDVDRTVIF